VCRGWEVVNCKMKVRVQELLEGIQCSSVAHFEFGGLLWTVLELRLEFSAVFFFYIPTSFSSHDLQVAILDEDGRTRPIRTRVQHCQIRTISSSK
jgi:hypothetical protein